MADTYQAISGARAKLFFNGNVPAGWATGVSASENIQLQRIDVLGDIDTQEIEPISRSVTMQCDFVRIIGKSLQTLGIWPDGNTVDVINFPEMTAEIYDPITDQRIYKIEGIKCETRSFRVDRQGLMTVNASFQARRLVDET